MNDSDPLIDTNGNRLYLTPNEREAFIEAAKRSPSRDVRTFATILYITGCRISEALALTPGRIDFNAEVIVFETLKKRKRGVYRAVPVPSEVLDTLDMVHGLKGAQKAKKTTILNKPLWPWSRKTAYTRIKELMDHAGISDGPHKTPKGLRHGYGVNAITKKVPLNMLKKWMGHSKLETTEMYLNAIGEEQKIIASQMWS